VRQLLNQTSGLHNYPLLSEHPWPLRGIIETRRIVDMLATDKADFAPGSRWEYSNANYAVLTAIVEQVGGEPMPPFSSKRFFGPLRPFERQDEIRADLFSDAGAV
jgi:D-alanyl-D-alanine carboxypeptidase